MSGRDAETFGVPGDVTMGTAMGVNDLGDLVVELERAAIRAEGKGQLNIGKLLRASATALVRSAAAAEGFDDDAGTLVQDLLVLSDRLAARGFDEATVERIALGAELISRGEPSFHGRFPDPWVCRRCGGVSASVPTTSCDACGAHELTYERFEPVYWLGEYAPAEAFERLQSNPALIEHAVRRLPPERLEWTPPGARWAASNVLRHLRDAESLLAQRIALILDHDDPPLVYRAVFEQAPEGGAATASTFLQQYVESRRASVARLRSIGPEAWQRTGRHQELGRVTLAQQASYFAAHELTHLRQLEQLRRALNGVAQP